MINNIFVAYLCSFCYYNYIELVHPIKHGADMKNQYFIAGRISDLEDEFRLVEADSQEEAEQLFEKWVRDELGEQGREFYIEHCETLASMQAAVLKQV